MNILKAEGEVRRSGRARRSTRKGDRKRKRGEEDEDELEELEERKPTRQSKRSKSKAKKQASSDEEGDVSFIFCFWVWSLIFLIGFSLPESRISRMGQIGFLDCFGPFTRIVRSVLASRSNLTIRLNRLEQSRNSIWSSTEIPETTKKWSY